MPIKAVRSVKFPALIKTTGAITIEKLGSEFTFDFDPLQCIPYDVGDAISYVAGVECNPAPKATVTTNDGYIYVFIGDDGYVTPPVFDPAQWVMISAPGTLAAAAEAEASAAAAEAAASEAATQAGLAASSAASVAGVVSSINVRRFATRAAMVAATLPGSVEYVDVEETVVGAGRRLTYKINNSATGIFGEVAVDSRWATPQYSYPNMIAGEWGAVGDNVADDTTSLNAAISYGLTQFAAGGVSPSLELTGKHRITDSLRVFLLNGAGTAFEFVSITILGATRNPGYVAGRAIGLYPTFVDRPAIIVQAARNFRVEGFNILGTANNGSVTIAQIATDVNWYNTASARDTRWSPYTAIAVDPFSLTVPADGGYPGYSSFYGIQNNGSSIARIDNMSIMRFVVGVMLSPSPTSPNNDAVIISQTTLFNCKVLVAIGQSQARGVALVDNFYGYFRTLVDTSNYGPGNGDFARIDGGVSIAGKWLMATNLGATSNGRITRFYAETLFSMGDWISQSPLTIQDSQIKIVDAPSLSVPAADYVLYNTGPVNFLGGIIASFDNTPWRLSFSNIAAVNCLGTQFNNVPHVLIPARFYARNCNLLNQAQGSIYGLSDHFDDALNNVGNSSTRAYLTPGGLLNDTAAGPTFNGGTITLRYAQTSNWESLPLETVAITVNSNGTATFTSATPELYVQHDALTTSTAWSMTSSPTGATVAGAGLSIGRVQSVVGSTITLQGVPVSLTSGTYALRVSRLPLIRKRMTGVFTSGSTSVTGLSDTATWIAGDYVKFRGANTATRVSSVSGTNMTLSRPATITGTHELYDAYLIINSAFGSVAPASGFYRIGEQVTLFTPTAVDGAGNLQTGWIATATGSPATWRATYSLDYAQTSASAVYDPASIVDADGFTTTISVPVAALGDFVDASFSNDLQGIVLSAWVSASGVVSVRFQNETGGTVDLASGTLRVRITKP
jgi:hypothetical protein